MGRFQCRMFFAIVLFGAGFATALYLVAPASESQTDQDRPQAAWTDQATDRQQVRQELLDVSCKLRLGMNKLVSFAEEQSVRLAEYVQQKWAEHQAADG